MRWNYIMECYGAQEMFTHPSSRALFYANSCREGRFSISHSWVIQNLTMFRECPSFPQEGEFHTKLYMYNTKEDQPMNFDILTILTHTLSPNKNVSPPKGICQLVSMVFSGSCFPLHYPLHRQIYNTPPTSWSGSKKTGL